MRSGGAGRWLVHWSVTIGDSALTDSRLEIVMKTEADQWREMLERRVVVRTCGMRRQQYHSTDWSGSVLVAQDEKFYALRWYQGGRRLIFDLEEQYADPRKMLEHLSSCNWHVSREYPIPRGHWAAPHEHVASVFLHPGIESALLNVEHPVLYGPYSRLLVEMETLAPRDETCMKTLLERFRALVQDLDERVWRSVFGMSVRA